MRLVLRFVATARHKGAEIGPHAEVTDAAVSGRVARVPCRFCKMVLNRMHKSGDGDIVVPQRGLSVVGTSSWVVNDPDELTVPEDHVERMYLEGAKLVPARRHAERRAAWSAARPLVGAGAGTGRELSRTFKTFDHAETEGGGGVRDAHRRQGNDATGDG